MIELLARLFIKDRHNTESPAVRTAYGTLVSITAIACNLLLSAAKFIIGSLAGSVSIAADAVNNLSDAGSSLLMLLGFKFAGKKPEPEHPFGHGRIEYIMGLIVAGIILYAGIDAFRSSISRVFHPEPIEFSWIAVVILVLSILVKVYMSFFQKKTGKRIGSSTMILAGEDALTDTISTILTLVCLLLYRFANWNLDAYAGLIVAFLLLKTGYEGAKETLSQILGQRPDPELVKQVQEIVLAHSEVLDIHDLVIHDYGPGRCHVTLHAEVDGAGDIYQLHDTMDRIMLELDHALNCMSVIHMDPVCTTDERLKTYREELQAILTGIDPGLSLHDFRIVPGPTHTNLIFDVLVPFRFRLPDEDVCRQIRAKVTANHPDCYCVIQVDKSFV